MKVRLIDRTPTTAAYLRHTGAYGEPLSRETSPWLATHGLLDQPRYGISHDDPSITSPEKCRYDASVEVPPRFAPSGKAFKTTLPGGRYAVLRSRASSLKCQQPGPPC